jgi:hypothetical protein
METEARAIAAELQAEFRRTAHYDIQIVSVEEDETGIRICFNFGRGTFSLDEVFALLHIARRHYMNAEFEAEADGDDLLVHVTLLRL